MCVCVCVCVRACVHMSIYNNYIRATILLGNSRTPRSDVFTKEVAVAVQKNACTVLVMF